MCWYVCVLSVTGEVIHGCNSCLHLPTWREKVVVVGGGSPPLSPPAGRRLLGLTWTLCPSWRYRSNTSALSTSLSVSPCGSCRGPPNQCEPTSTPSLREGGGLHDSLTLNYDTLHGEKEIWMVFFTAFYWLMQLRGTKKQTIKREDLLLSFMFL